MYLVPQSYMLKMLNGKFYVYFATIKKVKKKKKEKTRVNIHITESRLPTSAYFQYILHGIYISHLYMYDERVSLSHPKYPCKICFHLLLC